jgi:hypothetical protein
VLDLSSEIVLVDEMPSPAGNHNAGDLAIDRDGYLYVSIGDGGCNHAGGGGAGSNNASRDENLLTGKVLRLAVNPDGSTSIPGLAAAVLGGWLAVVVLAQTGFAVVVTASILAVWAAILAGLADEGPSGHGPAPGVGPAGRRADAGSDRGTGGHHRVGRRLAILRSPPRPSHRSRRRGPRGRRRGFGQRGLGGRKGAGRPAGRNGTLGGGSGGASLEGQSARPPGTISMSARVARAKPRGPQLGTRLVPLDAYG